MEVTISLLDSYAEQVFGNRNWLLDNVVLEQTLRYIESKHCIDKDGNVCPLTTFCDSTNGVDSRAYSPTPYNIVIRMIRNGQMPTIDENGWESLNKPPFPVEQYLEKLSETKVFRNTKESKVVVFVRRASDKWIIEFAACLFGILNWVYDGQKCDEEEARLFSAIHERDEKTFDEIIDKRAVELDCFGRIQKRNLHSWGDRIRQAQVKSLQAQIESSYSDINSYQSRLERTYSRLEIMKVQLEGLQSIDNDDGDTLYNFFATHPQLHIIDTEINGEVPVVRFSIDETLEYFDEESMKTVCSRPTSFVYSRGDKAAQIFKGIFLENKGLIRVESVFTLSGLTALSPKKGGRNDKFIRLTLPHPHLYHFGCLGGNKIYIDKFLSEGQWDTAIEQVIATTKNINLGDTTTMRCFIEDISNSVGTGVRYIIADNGKEMTADEFLAYITPTETSNEVQHEGDD